MRSQVILVILLIIKEEINIFYIPNIPSFRLFLADATEDKGTVKVRRHITTT